METKNRYFEEAFLPKPKNFNSLNKDILKLYLDEESADVVFEVSEEGRVANGPKRAKISPNKFHAHRLILRTRAPQLAEMCGKDESVTIADVKPGIFRLVLYHIYGGTVSEAKMKANAKDIIDASNRYGVVHLKLAAEACCVKSTTITIDNVMDNLIYADSMNLALLKEALMDFVAKNKVEAIEKIPFSDFPGHLTKDLLVSIARGEKKFSSDDGFTTMSVGELRKNLGEKGLDFDGSREAMIASLKQHSAEQQNEFTGFGGGFHLRESSNIKD